MKSVLKILLAVFSGIYLSACEKDKINHTPHNQQPVAKAGNDTSLFFPVNFIVLDGSGSYDLDGKIVNFYWSKIGGPPGFAISNANEVQTVVSSLEKGLYQFDVCR